MLKTFSLYKRNVTKNKHSFFSFASFNSITVLLFICSLYTRWSARFISLKLCVRFSIFDSASFLLKFILFCSIKSMESWTSKRHNFFQNKDNRKATRSFASRSLIFKLQQEILKFSGICLSWNSPKTDLAKNFLNF